MLNTIDLLVYKYPEIIITDKDANGKKYKNTRWLYLKNRQRRCNVFLEIWYRPIVCRWDFIMYRNMMTPSENASAPLDGNKRENDIRGMLQLYYLSQGQAAEFVENKIKKYLSIIKE